MWTNTVVSSGLIAYLGWSCYTIIKSTDPPTCQQDCLGPAPLDRFVSHLYITNYIPHRLTYEDRLQPFVSNSNEESIYIGSFDVDKNIDLCQKSGSIKHKYTNPITKMIKGDPCIQYLEAVIPESLMSNDTELYLIALNADAQNGQQQVIKPALAPISVKYTPEKKQRSSRKLLLTDKVVEEGITESYMALPHRIRIGQIELDVPLDKTKLIHLGRRSWIRPNNEYVPEMHIETYVTPRDEYMPQLPAYHAIRGLAHKHYTEDKAVITIEYEATSWRKSALERLMLNALEKMEGTFSSQYDVDSLKLLFTGESPIVLLVTFITSALHMLFEFLSLSSNWTFFRSSLKTQEKAEGLSAQGILMDTIFEVLIFGWLRDEGEAKIVQFLLLIKIVFNIYKYLQLKRAQAGNDTPIMTILRKAIKHPHHCLYPSVLNQWRKDYDANTFEKLTLACLSIVSSPLMVGIALYQLLAVPQKSWLSYVLKCGAHSAYIGGFIAMTPQLYKNYYKRTVEHLPWVSLTYNFLNTVIDDLFSVLIRMPKEHRISVFRDDIIFIVYWIQKWHYSRKPSKSEKQD